MMLKSKFEQIYAFYFQCETEAKPVTRTKPCVINSDTEMICHVPELCENLKVNFNKSQQKRDAAYSDGSINVEIIIHLDGVNESFSIYYYSDPSFDPFVEESKTKLFESNKQKLIIRVNVLKYFFVS